MLAPRGMIQWLGLVVAAVGRLRANRTAGEVLLVALLKLSSNECASTV